MLVRPMDGGRMIGRNRIAAIAAAFATACAFLGATAAHSDTPANAHFSNPGTVALPGVGLSLAWSAGDAIAAGGHFRDSVSHERYDTRTINVPTMRLAKAFDCHYWWTMAQACSAIRTSARSSPTAAATMP
jgi:hypothetical protein